MKEGFIREVYLRSIPSVDLEIVTGQVDCTKHTIKMSVYGELLAEFCENKEDRMKAHMFMLASGPQIVEDDAVVDSSDSRDRQTKDAFYKGETTATGFETDDGGSRVHFIKGFENTSHFNKEALLLITSFITDDAEALGAEGLPDKLYITCCDIDRIYLSANPDATIESAPDYLVRMWDYHICEDDPERVHMDCTFHIMKECPDGSSCSAEQFDGEYDILIYGKIAKLKVSVLKGLSTIHIPDDVTAIPRDAFSRCPDLKEVHIPEGVTTIEPLAFAYCKGLSRIDLPESLTTIGFWAFLGCSCLQEIHIPDNVIEIGSEAFRHCDSLREISVPVLNISGTGLREETHVSLRANEGERQIPEGISCIPPEIFKDCSGIKSVRIPNSVTKIGRDAFRGCSGLQEIIIPDSVMIIGQDAFKDCDNLTEISIPIGLSVASAGIEESTRVVIRNNDGVRVLPEGVTEIEPSAFEGRAELKGIAIPDSVSSIGKHAFKGCTSLSEIYIPENVTSIANNAFDGCGNLSRLTVSPNNAVYDSREDSNAIIETESGRIIAECKSTVLSDSWFKSICETYGFIGSDDPDEEIRTLTILKNNWVPDDEDEGEEEQLGESIRRYVSTRFRKEWYKNYIGTKKITFDGPASYEETGEITDEDISAFMGGSWKDFLNYRLKVGHTERQDRFTALMRDYPLEILDWLHGGWNDDVIPYYFYEGLAKGGEYELYGCSKDDFINIVWNEELDEQDKYFEYAAILEEEFEIDYAVEFLVAMEWHLWFWEYSDGVAGLIVDLFSKAVSLGDNEEALMAMGLIAIRYNYELQEMNYTYKFNSNGIFSLNPPDLSIKMYSRLAAMWKKGLITDSWIINDYDSRHGCYTISPGNNRIKNARNPGLAAIFDWVWGDDMWDEDDYPEYPDEDVYRIWLQKLLESDFADDIAGYLNPLLIMVLEKEKKHNWETGKKAIESFLAKNAVSS